MDLNERSKMLGHAFSAADIEFLLAIREFATAFEHARSIEDIDRICQLGAMILARRKDDRTRNG
jgi:hypothetical protein